MEHEEEDEDSIEEKIAYSLNGIDPTGELSSVESKGDRYATIINQADEFAAGQVAGGRTGQEIMMFGLRLYMLGSLLHTQSVMKALKFKPPKSEDESHSGMYQ